MSQTHMCERGGSGRSSSSRAAFSQTAGQEVWRPGSDDRDQDPLPDPTQTLIQEFPGYFTPPFSECSVSVSTGPADRRRELQSPDDGRPSTSSKRSRRDSSAGIFPTSSLSSSVGNVKRWLCGLKSFSSKGSYIVLWKRSGDRSKSQYEQDSCGNMRLSRTNSFEEFLCPPLPGQVPIEPTETSHVLMEASPVNKSSTEKPTGCKKRKGTGSFLKRLRKAMKRSFLCCCAVDDVEPFVPPADLDPDPDSSSPDPDHSAIKPNNECFETLYNVGEMIGSGGFGRVFEGTRKFDGKKVAIKRMRKTCSDLYLAIPGCPKPLITEVALLLMMRQEPISPYVIQLYDWFEHPRKLTLIMEFPEPCESLLDFISRNPELDEPTARVIMRQAVLAVQHCIERGVFHNDVHAQNFLLRKNMLELKLIDFGSGHLLSADGYESDIYVGMLDHCPPEVHTEPRYHAVPTNVWALGVMLYEMVNACRPFYTTEEITEAKVIFENSNLSKGNNTLAVVAGGLELET